MQVSSTVFIERLRPSAGSYLAMSLIFPMILLAALPFGLGFAGFASVISLIGLLGLATAIAPKIEVNQSLRAGRIVIPLEIIGGVEVLSGDQAKMAMGPGLDSRARLMIRGDIKDLVKVIIEDQNDPTPYLLISSRRAKELASALGADFAIL